MNNPTTTTTTRSALASKAMLVYLSISQWTARKFDSKATKEVADNHGATKEIGRYWKRLIDMAEIKKINKIAGEARTYNYETTLVWLDNGARILPAKLFEEYTIKMAEFKARFETAVADFVIAYPSLIEGARKELNGLFNENDYPSPYVVASKYRFVLDALPLPNVEDFRVDISQDQLDRLHKEMEKKFNATTAKAMADVWERLHSVVNHMADKLADPSAKFHDSLTGNLAELVRILPALNIAGDPELDALTADVAARLLAYDPKTLRKDPAKRAEIARTAKAMAANIGIASGVVVVVAPAPVAPAPVAPAPVAPAPVAPVAPAPVAPAPVAPIVAPVAPIVAPVAPVAPIVAPVAPIVAPVAPAPVALTPSEILAKIYG